jgi:hypothetical protein
MKKINSLLFYLICLLFFLVGLLFLYLCTPASPPKTLYEALSVNEQVIVDTVLDEFKRHHLFYLPEYSEVLKLTAATARSDSDSSHDHNSIEEGSYKDEHLDIKITGATPDKEGKYHTPTMQFMPDRLHTYQELYTVLISKQLITVEVSEMLEDTPYRSPKNPDPDFIEDLAKRVKGRITEPGLIALP